MQIALRPCGAVFIILHAVCTISTRARYLRGINANYNADFYAYTCSQYVLTYPSNTSILANLPKIHKQKYPTGYSLPCINETVLAVTFSFARKTALVIQS